MYHNFRRGRLVKPTPRHERPVFDNPKDLLHTLIFHGCSPDAKWCISSHQTNFQQVTETLLATNQGGQVVNLFNGQPYPPGYDSDDAPLVTGFHVTPVSNLPSIIVNGLFPSIALGGKLGMKILGCPLVGIPVSTNQFHAERQLRGHIVSGINDDTQEERRLPAGSCDCLGGMNPAFY